MRKVIVGAFVSLDGVMQAPGGPKEDESGGFTHGGWMAGLGDAEVEPEIGAMMAEPYDLLLGKRTWDIFASYWPTAPREPGEKGYNEGDAKISKEFDRITKYVATHTPDELKKWVRSESLGSDAIAGVRALKKADGPRLLTQGSTELLHQLLHHGLVDELVLFIHPVVLGAGKRLFDDRSSASTFTVKKSKVTKKGTVVAHYEKAGEVKTGSFMPE